MLQDKMIKLMSAKKEKGDVLSPMAAHAKSGVLQDLLSQIAGGAKDKLGNLKKVTVASNDPHGLAEGLDKAKSMVTGQDGDDSDGSEDSDEPGEDDPAAEIEEDAKELTPEQLDQEIQKLLALKAQLEAHKA